MNKLSLIMLSALALAGCTGSNNKSSDGSFKEELSLTADSVEMEAIIKPGNIYFADPYIIVANTLASDGFNYAVFNKDLSYLYSFCPTGQDHPTASCRLSSITCPTANSWS